MSYFFVFFFGEYLVEIEKISNILRKKPFGGARRLSFRIIARAVCGIHKSQNQGLTSVDRRTSLLSHLQYPVLSESSTKDLSLSVPERRLNMVLGRSLSLRVNTESGVYRRFPAWILTQRRSVIILQMVASGHWLFSQPHKPIV